MSLELVEGVSVEELQTALATIPTLELGLVVAGPPCQGFSGLNRDRKGFKDSRSDGILQLVSLIQKLKEAGPNIEWNCLTENVASMTSTDMFDITEHLGKTTITEHLGRTTPVWPFQPFHLDAALFGHINRPRVYWVDFPVEPVGLKFERRIDYLKFTKTLPEVVKPPISEFLDEGTVKCGAGLFPTAVRWLPRAEPPSDPAGYEDCDAETLEKWTASGYAMAPYQFKKELGVIDKSGEERPPNADEREKLHGFKPGHTQGFSESRRISFQGIPFIALQLRTFCPNMRIIAGIFHVSLSSRNSGTEPGI